MLRQVRMRETEKRVGKNFYLCIDTRQYLKKDYLVLKVLMNICIKQCTLLPFLLIITVCLQYVKSLVLTKVEYAMAITGVNL